MITTGYSGRDQWEIRRSSTALLLVDVQNSELSAQSAKKRPDYYQRIVSTALPNQKALIKAARSLGLEVLYTVIEALTSDGRDRSLDHKLSGILVPKGSEQARVISEVAPNHDDMVFRKTSSGVFTSTNIDYVLRNLGIETLIVCGFLTDQCVDLAVREAADRGYFAVCVSDACAAYSAERHHNALAAFGGYCRIARTEEIIRELQEAAV